MSLPGPTHTIARAAGSCGKLARLRPVEVGLLAALLALSGCGTGLESLTTGTAPTAASTSSVTTGDPIAATEHAAPVSGGGGAIATTAATTTTGASGEDGGEGCGAIDGPGGRFVISSEDHLRCVEALSVFRELFAGRGDKHRGVDEAETYTEVDGWSCGSGAGGFGCERSGARIEAHAEG